MAYTGSLPFRYDHEDIAFAIELSHSDDTPFPFDEYSLECAIGTDNGNTLLLTEGNAGVQPDPATGVVLFKLGRLSSDNYTVSCDAVETTSGDHTTLFALSLHVAEGAF